MNRTLEKRLCRLEADHPANDGQPLVLEILEGEPVPEEFKGLLIIHPRPSTAEDHDQ
jgi:hypothetical protein